MTEDLLSLEDVAGILRAAEFHECADAVAAAIAERDALLIHNGKGTALEKIGAVGRKPLVSKHRAANYAHLRPLIERLDAAGDREAADTIVWLVWWRCLDAERERALLADADRETASAIAERDALRARVEGLEDALKPFAYDDGTLDAEEVVHHARAAIRKTGEQG